jgi:hypothetical protein
MVELTMRAVSSSGPQTTSQQTNIFKKFFIEIFVASSGLQSVCCSVSLNGRWSCVGDSLLRKKKSRVLLNANFCVAVHLTSPSCHGNVECAAVWAVGQSP